MTGPEYLEHIAQLLLQHGIIPQITEEMMRQAGEELHRHVTSPYPPWGISSACLLEALVPFLTETSERLLWFDAEMDSDTYADLVRRFAAATGGEWAPERMEIDVIADKYTNDFQFTLDVEVRGEVIHGEWTDSSKWAAEGFLDLIERIAQTHLSGAFVDIPMHDQTMLFAYLPHPCVRDLEALLDLLEHEYPDFVTFAHTF